MLSAPMGLVASCVKSGQKESLFVYLWLRYYGVPNDKLAHIIEIISHKCRMEPDAVQASLAWLNQEGWIKVNLPATRNQA